MRTIKLFITPSDAAMTNESVMAVGVPFVQGEVGLDTPIAIERADDQIAAQVRPLTTWPDESIRWAQVVFPITMKDVAKGFVILKNDAAAMVEDGISITETKGESLRIQTQKACFTINEKKGTILDSVKIDDQEMIDASVNHGFTLRDTRGREFRSALDESPTVEVIETGPYRVVVRQRLRLRHEKTAHTPLMLDARLSFYFNSGQVSATVTYTASDQEPEQFFHDLRWNLGYAFECGRNCDMTGRYPKAHMEKAETKAPDDALPRFSIGCGFDDVYEDHIDRDNSYFLLQTMDNFFNVHQTEPEFGAYPVASGGARGEHGPGWVELKGASERILWRLRDFWQSFPKEIELTQNTLSFAIWPERALPAFLNLPHVPEPTDPVKRWALDGYECIATFPQYSGASVSRKCYSMLAGSSCSHGFDFAFLSGREDVPARQWHAFNEKPPLVWVDPEHIHRAGVLGPFTVPRDDHDTLGVYEEMLERAFAWEERMREQYRSYGELDYGDLQRHYHTVRMPKSSKGLMRARKDGGGFARCHPRAGWWNNNERDTHRAYYIQYMRSGRHDYHHRFLTSASHNMEVDFIRLRGGHSCEHVGPGLLGHQEGHNRRYGRGFDMDHNWCCGFFDLYHLTGDPRAWESACLVADHLARLSVHGFEWFNLQKETMHLRYFFRSVWELSTAYVEAHNEAYLDAARIGAEEILRRQNADGGFGGKSSYGEGSCVIALLRFYLAAKETKYLDAVRRAVLYMTDDLEQFDFSPEELGKERRAPLIPFNSRKVLAGEFVGLPKVAESLAYLLTMGERDAALRGRARLLLDTALAAQDRTGRAIEDGNWNEEHRAMPYRTANALQHLPLLISAMRHVDDGPSDSTSMGNVQ